MNALIDTLTRYDILIAHGADLFYQAMRSEAVHHPAFLVAAPIAAVLFVIYLWSRSTDCLLFLAATGLYVLPVLMS